MKFFSKIFMIFSKILIMFSKKIRYDIYRISQQKGNIACIDNYVIVLLYHNLEGFSPV